MAIIASHSYLANIALATMLTVATFTLPGCASTKTASGDQINDTKTLVLHTGDEIRLITCQRQRFKLRITSISEDGLSGKTLPWPASNVAPGQEVTVAYLELAFVQRDKASPLLTAGLVAGVTMIGAMIAAVTVGPAPVMP